MNHLYLITQKFLKPTTTVCFSCTVQGPRIVVHTAARAHHMDAIEQWCCKMFGHPQVKGRWHIEYTNMIHFIDPSDAVVFQLAWHGVPIE